jgi:hypothetical protein
MTQSPKVEQGELRIKNKTGRIRRRGNSKRTAPGVAKRVAKSENMRKQTKKLTDEFVCELPDCSTLGPCDTA